jgi:hypothetical protein
MMIHGLPAASRIRTAWGVASAKPPRWPRVAIDRMNTPSSVAWSCMRMRSPRIAPPVKGLLGSIARTPTSRPSPRTMPMTLSVSVDLPEPGAPVTPIV